MSESAAHWCKSVVEEVTPVVKSIPPPPRPPQFKSPTDFASTTSASSSQPTSQQQTQKPLTPFEMQYQQYYSSVYYGQQSAQPSASTHNSQGTSVGQQLSQVTATSSMQQYTPQPIVSSYAYRYPGYYGHQSQAHTPATPYYNYATQASAAHAPPVPPPPSTASIPPPPPPAPVKKPNKSRFQPVGDTSDTTSESSNSAKSRPVAPQKVVGGDGVSGTSDSTKTEPWPPAMKLFVEKTFKEYSQPEDRAHATTELQKLIARVLADGRLKVHRWDLESIPPRPIQTAVAKPAVSSSSLPNQRTGLQAEMYNRSEKYSDREWAGKDEWKRAKGGKVNVAEPGRDQKSPRGSPRGNSTSYYGPSDFVGGDDNDDDDDDELGGTKKRKSRWGDSQWGENNPYGSTTSANGFGRSTSSSAYDLYGPGATKTHGESEVGAGGSRKSKGGIYGGDGGESDLTIAERKLREKRANRFKGTEDSAGMAVAVAVAAAAATVAAGKKKKKRFSTNLGNLAGVGGGGGIDFDMETLKIVGTCQKLEKEYFRLTSPPDPSTVRPLDVLREALTALKSKWRDDAVDYVYMCSQLKAVRQDLTVQNVKSDFTVDVYETHARVALESGDLNEYNQCQTQLKQLYAVGMKGSEPEFVAYRVLYYVYLLGNRKYEGGGTDLADIMVSICSRPDLSSDEAVAHALSVREAIRSANYHRFFALYSTAPNMGAYILDLMLDAWRLYALQRICKAYKPVISTAFVIQELAFASTEEGLDFLRKAGCVLIQPASPTTAGSADALAGRVGGSVEGAGIGVGIDWDISIKDTVLDASAVFTQDKLLL